MSNRNYTQEKGCLQKSVVSVYGAIALSAAAAVSSFSGPQLFSVAKTGTGTYLITLTDAFTSLLGFSFGIKSLNGIDLLVQLSAEDVAVAKTLTVKTLVAGTVADVASAVDIFVDLKLKDSSVLP